MDKRHNKAMMFKECLGLNFAVNILIACVTDNINVVVFVFGNVVKGPRDGKGTRGRT
jgi:hypothetical protein